MKGTNIKYHGSRKVLWNKDLDLYIEWLHLVFPNISPERLAVRCILVKSLNFKNERTLWVSRQKIQKKKIFSLASNLLSSTVKPRKQGKTPSTSFNLKEGVSILYKAKLFFKINTTQESFLGNLLTDEFHLT